MTRGVPSPRKIAAASRVLWAEYEEIPTYRALPCRTAASSALIVSARGVSGEALVQAGQEVLARPTIAVGPGPHVVARLGGDNQLVAVWAQVRSEDPPE